MLTYATTQMNFNGIMLSGISQSQKAKHGLILASTRDRQENNVLPEATGKGSRELLFHGELVFQDEKSCGDAWWRGSHIVKVFDGIELYSLKGKFYVCVFYHH